MLVVRGSPSAEPHLASVQHTRLFQRRAVLADSMHGPDQNLFFSPLPSLRQEALHCYLSGAFVVRGGKAAQWKFSIGISREHLLA